MKTVLAAFWRIFGGPKLLFAAVELAMAYAATRWPDAPLPDATFMTSLAASLYGAHSFRDAVRVLQTALVEYAAGRAGNTRPPLPPETR